MSIQRLYTAQATVTGGRDGRAISSDNVIDLPLSTPKEMGGPGKADSTNMTDRSAALSALVHAEAPGAARAMATVYDDFSKEALVVDKWFAMQASAPNTDLAALSALIHARAPGADASLQRFYDEFEDEPLVIDKWFALQATAPTTNVAAVRTLMKHRAFSMKNPNRARSLIFSFCNGNPSQFHAADGSGYQFWAEQVIALDIINPQVSARLARTMDRWRKYAPALQAQMQAALRRVAATPRLSKDLAEVITKALASD